MEQPRLFRVFTLLLFVLAILVGGGICVPSAFGANLIARWKLNEPGSPYADAGPNNVILKQDTSTTVALSVTGIEGAAAQLGWQNPPGVSTRLVATNPVIQSDSFGFSFWFNPVSINDFDNLMAKEMSFNNTVPNYSRMAWQIHLLGNNGSGMAALEFIVRGDRRAQGDFFGTAVSAATIPLHTNTPDWIHVAGGYDAATGALRLYVNGVEYISGNSSAGAHNSDGSPISIGTTRNGSDFVAFAAIADIEDLQLYDGPLTASDVAFLKSNPGQAIRNFVISSFALNASTGAVAATVSTIPGAYYSVEVSSAVGGFSAVTNFTAQSDFAAINVSKATLDGVLGSAPRSKFFLRVQEQAVLPRFATCD